MLFINEVDIGPAAGRTFRGYWSGKSVYASCTRSVRDLNRGGGKK